jgi:Holliday junction resolvase RusA-like endonuclease
MSEPVTLALALTHANPRKCRVSLVVYGVAAPAGSKTLARANGKTWVRDSSKRGYQWRRDVAQAAGLATRGRPLLDGPLALAVTFVVPRPKSHYGARGLRPSAPAYPTTRPDVTKLLRAVEDALTGIVWRDDAQVVEQHAWKRYGEPARCELHVELAAPRKIVDTVDTLKSAGSA